MATFVSSSNNNNNDNKKDILKNNNNIVANSSPGSLPFGLNQQRNKPQTMTKIATTTKTSTLPSSSSSTMVIDIGINITSKQMIQKWREVVERAVVTANVATMILTGTSIRSSTKSNIYMISYHTKVKEKVGSIEKLRI